MGTFPSWMEDDYNKIANKGPLSTLIFGHRFKVDQTLYEYLTEFFWYLFLQKTKTCRKEKCNSTM